MTEANDEPNRRRVSAPRNRTLTIIVQLFHIPNFVLLNSVYWNATGASISRRYSFFACENMFESFLKCPHSFAKYRPFDEPFQGMAFPGRENTFDSRCGKIGPIWIGPGHEENRYRGYDEARTR